ncbi:MAG: hypothetical protein HPY44_07305 [Armatimonadetes bacterium]|nr:hypothetical protein [Armatimonadota bacterium]
MNRVSMVLAAAVCLCVAAFAQGPPGLDFSKVGIYAVDYEFLDFTNFKFAATQNPEGYAKRVRDAHERGQFVMVGLYTWDRVSHKKPLEEVFADTDRILDALDLSLVDLIFLHEEEVDWQGGFDYLNAIYDHVKAKYDGPVYQWYSMPMGPRCDQKADGWILDAYGMDYDTFRKHLMRFIVIDKPVVACINATPGINSFQCSQEQVRVCREFNIPVFYFCVHGPLGSVNVYMQTDDPEAAKWRGWMLRTFEDCHRLDASRLPEEAAQHSYAGPVEVSGDETGRFTFMDDFATDGFLRRATIHGFLNLSWSSLDKTLRLKGTGEARKAELIYHLWTPFQIAVPQVRAEGQGKLAVALSADGRSWTESDSGNGPSCALSDMKGSNLWVRVSMQGGDGPSPALDLLEVTGSFAGPEEKAYNLLKAPVGGGPAKVTYQDDFQSQRYLHIGETFGGENLVWQPGALSTHGIEGYGVSAGIRQHFVSDRPLDVSTVEVDCLALAGHGGHNTLGFSLDGSEVIAEATTQGKERAGDRRFQGVLQLDLSAEPRAKGIREFWVHLTMVNGSGKLTNTSNQLRKLTIQAATSVE